MAGKLDAEWTASGKRSRYPVLYRKASDSIRTAFELEAHRRIVTRLHILREPRNSQVTDDDIPAANSELSLLRKLLSTHGFPSLNDRCLGEEPLEWSHPTSSFWDPAPAHLSCTHSCPCTHSCAPPNSK